MSCIDLEIINIVHLSRTGKQDVDLSVADLIEADKANTGAPKTRFIPISFKVSHLLKTNLPEGD